MVALSLLRRLFRLSGHAPRNRQADRHLAVFMFSLLFLAGGNITVSVNRHLTGPVTLSSMMFPFYLCGLLGSIVNANIKSPCYNELDKRLSTDINSSEDGFSYLLLTVYIVLASCCYVSWRLEGHVLVVMTSKVLSSHYLLIPFLQFILIVQMLHKKFGSINKELESVLANIRGTTQVPSKVSALLREHVDMRNVTMDISSYFSFYIFCLSVFFVFSLTNNLYGLLLVLSTSSTNKVNLLSILWNDIVGQVPLVFIAVTSMISCHYCTEQANKTVLISLKSVAANSSLEVLDRIERFSLICFKNPVEFSVYGVFTLNNELITKVFAISLTYLSIALQINAVKIQPNRT